MWHLRHEHYPSPPPREQTPAGFVVRLHIPRAHARPPQISSHLAPHRKPPVPVGRRMHEARHQRATQCRSYNPPTFKHCGSRRPTVWQDLTPLPYSDPCTGPKGTHSASTPPTKTGATPSKGAVAHISNSTSRQPTRCLTSAPSTSKHEPHPATPPTIPHIHKAARGPILNRTELLKRMAAALRRDT